MMTKNETWDAVMISLFSEFIFHLFSSHVEELSFSFQFFLLITILIFFLSMTTNN